MFLKMRKLCEEYCIPQFALVVSILFTASVYSAESGVRGSSGSSTAVLASNINSLTHALELAIQNDPWQRTAEFRQQALVAEGEALNTFDDPVISLGLQNLPTSGFAFDQEPMTQLKLGVSQMLPQGDARTIAQERAVSRGQQYPILSTQRKLDIKVALATQWVEAQRIQQQLGYIERQRDLFTQLIQIVKREFASAQGNAKQEDVLQAELENIRIEEQVARLEAQYANAVAILGEWLGTDLSIEVSDRFIELRIPELLAKTAKDNQAKLTQSLLAKIVIEHPKMQVFDQQIATSELDIALAEQRYEPKWGLNASYGYRADDPNNNSRADFFSIGVSVQMPLFSKVRQDRLVKATTLQSQSLHTEKLLQMRTLMAQLDALYQRWLGVGRQLMISQQAVLPKLSERADAALASYTNADGSFETVMRARIAAFKGELDHIQLNAEQVKLLIQLHYFFPQEQFIMEPLS